MQMLRVISQERHQDAILTAFLQGAGKKGETFGAFQARHGMRQRTKPADEAPERVIESVRARLGSLYRAPIKA